MNTVFLTGGGTAGHIAPNLALLPYLSDCAVHYCGAKDSMEEKLLQDYPSVTFHALPCIRFARSFSPKNLKIPFVLHSGVREAKKLLHAFAPAVVFGKGGYAALPVCLAAAKLHIPLVIHESDISMGLSNRLVADKAQKVCASFPDVAARYEHGVFTGTPLRRELYSGKADNIRRTFSFPKNTKPNLLVFGGSQGAAAINGAVEQSLQRLCAVYNVLHIAGAHPFDGQYENYRRCEYCKQMADCYAWADCIVCRGGAGTLAEIVALRKPALVVPLPKSKHSRGDQQQNANYYKKLGCVRVLEQESLTPDALVARLQALREDKSALLAAMAAVPSPDGTRRVAELIRSYFPVR